MSASILDPRMINSSKPLSCLEIQTSVLTAQDTITTNNLIVNNNLALFGDLSADDLTIDSLVTNNLTSATISTTAVTTTTLTTVSANINQAVITGPVVSNFFVETVALSTYNFTNNDNAKIFHFDTNAQPEITATFLSANISNGFNIGIINTGLGVIYLSSDFVPVINATNTFNSVRYSGMFIYRIDNQLYGIGVFE